MKASSTIFITAVSAVVWLSSASAEAAERNFIIPSVPGLQDGPIASNEMPPDVLLAPGGSNSSVDLKPLVLDDRFKAKKIIDKARELNLMPLPLVQTADEKQDSDELVSTSEKAQLLELWTAAISRYPDIQFAIVHLQPTSDPAHVSALATKALANLVFSGGSAASMIMGTPAGRFGTSAGASLLQQVLGNTSGGKKQVQLSQEQTTMLYQMIRNTADRLSMSYRLYRLHLEDYQRSVDDLNELKELAANGGQAASGAATEYLLNKARRETAIAKGEATLYRKELVDLSGAEAVDELDKQIDDEQVALNKLIGGQMSKIDDSATPLQDTKHVQNLQQQHSAANQ
jgi:hypothetical protein